MASDVIERWKASAY